MKRLLFTSIFIFIFIFINKIFASSVRISQIDSATLLLNQNIKLYISVTDDTGMPIENLSKKNFKIFESSKENDFVKIEDIVYFKTKANYELGINFLLLIDNSGSMYRTLNNKRTRDTNRTKITYAKNAAVTFLRSITNPKDNIGLVSYNSYYNSFSEPISNKIKIEEYLEEIERPSRDEAYTEIYASLSQAVDEFRSVRGRKAIIILSDGENQPYYRYTKKEHKVFGKKIFKYTEPIEHCQREGISVFSIYFGKKGGKKDKNLSKIAIQTGGSIFDAYNQEELNMIYERIVNQILNEYLVSYKATMEPGDKKYVKVVCNTTTGDTFVKRFYFSSTVFGIPLKYFNPFILFPFFLALLLLWILSRIDFEKKKSTPSIEVLSAGASKISTKLFNLSEGKTIIGGAPSADMTIVGGVTKIKEKHATIEYDKKKKNYTIVGDGKLTVNNKPVTTKVLESGDVINIGGTTIVFDDGEVE